MMVTNTTIIKNKGRILLVPKIPTLGSSDNIEKEKPESRAREFQAPCRVVAVKTYKIPMPNRF